MPGVMTVLGPIEADALGITLPHEHIQLDLYRITRIRDFYVDDLGLAIEEIKRFKELGGRTIVDLTNFGMGRRPDALVQAATESGVNVVMGTGHYRNPFMDPDLERRSVDDIAAEIVAEIEDGVGPDHIRPGAIGEVGIERAWIHPLEERCLRAAARAHQRTGVPISIHAANSPAGLDGLALMREEGVDLTKVVLSHCDTYPDLDFQEAVARTGAFVEFDRNSPMWPWEQQRRVEHIVKLVRMGFGRQILLSHDVCKVSERASYGGPGYQYLLEAVAPMLRDAGLGDEELGWFFAENPRRWLAG